MYLKDDKIRINIEGLIIESHLARDGITGAPLKAPQYLLDPSAIKGWYDGVDVRRKTAERGTSWGDFVQPSSLSSRLISLTGTAVATTISEIHAMRDYFVAVLVEQSNDGYRYFELTDYSGTKHTSVSLASKPNWVPITDTAASWSMELYAPDPRIYGETKNLILQGAPITGGLQFDQHVNNSVSPAKTEYILSYPMEYGVVTQLQDQFITNTGNTDAWPSYVVYGDYSDFEIRYDGVGKVIRYVGPVSLNAPIVIDSRTGLATQNGTDRSVFLKRRDWYSIPAYTTVHPKFVPGQSTTGWCQIKYEDTFI